MSDPILVTRSSMPPIEEYIEEIRELWDTHWLTNMGMKHKEMETQLEKYLGVEHVSLFSNGHMALELAIQALDLSGEVITTPFTFASTTHAIVRNNLTPVFCDINEKDFTMDTTKLESLITDKTSAILPVHVYGNICNMEEIEELAGKYGLKVLYDAAHTFGETYKGAGIGNYGDASVFSFHATKVYNSIEGGAVCFKNKEFGLSLYRLKNFGIRDEETVDSIGANAKMNEFQAAMGICNLRHIDEEIEKRSYVHKQYLERLSGVEGLYIAEKQDHVKPNYAYFPVVFHEKQFGATRNEVYNKLAMNGIYARKYFYPLTNMFQCYRDRYGQQETPVAVHISKRILTLPMYADLKKEEIEEICNIILSLKK